MTRLVCLIFGVLFFLAACTNTENNTVKNEEVMIADQRNIENDSFKIDFPEIIELTYHPVQLSAIEERGPDSSLEYLHSFPIGSIQDKEATLHVYKEHDESKICGLNYETTSFVEYDQQIHLLPVCTSINFTNDEPGYFLQLYQLKNSSSQIIQAGIELASNGAGRTLFLLYDQSKKQWLAFEDWGVPVFKESGESYTDSFLFDFPGLHMKGSDIAFYRWNNGNLEKSDSVSDSLGFSDGYFIQAALATLEIEIVIDVDVVTQNNLEFEVQYKYEDDRLIKKSS